MEDKIININNIPAIVLDSFYFKSYLSNYEAVRACKIFYKGRIEYCESFNGIDYIIFYNTYEDAYRNTKNHHVAAPTAWNHNSDLGNIY